jgi:hypothetical protein
MQARLTKGGKRMPMDPFSFWMQASVFWARVFKQQHDAYLQMLGAIAVKVPHPDAAELSAQAAAQASPAAKAAAPRVLAKKAPAAKAKQPEPAIA